MQAEHIHTRVWVLSKLKNYILGWWSLTSYVLTKHVLSLI